MKRPLSFVHTIIINLIRLILLITFVHSYFSNRPIIEIVSILALFITFVPPILKILFKVNVPSSFEIIYLMCIYGILILGELRGFYKGIWWWSILTSLTASIALSFVALTIIHVLYRKNKISKSPILVGIFIFSFSVTFGIFWELFEFTLDLLVHSGLQKSLFDTMQDISINILGAIIVSILGAFYIKKEKGYFVSTFFSEIIEEVFHMRKEGKQNPEEQIMKIISKGESERVEFKSSIRTNLYTKMFDRQMELAVLKSITAFLNTNGGILLIGINDSGEIIGLENDGFQNADKIGLHLTNLIKTTIGNNFLPFIKFDIVNIKGKVIVLVRCEESKRQVFLKEGNEERFYVRNGPASIRLDGSSLVDYIRHKFRDG